MFVIKLKHKSMDYDFEVLCELGIGKKIDHEF